MSKKVRYQIPTTFSKKVGDQKNLVQFEASNVSTQKTKFGEYSILFFIKSKEKQSEFEEFAKSNKIDFKIII